MSDGYSTLATSLINLQTILMRTRVTTTDFSLLSLYSRYRDRVSRRSHRDTRDLTPPKTLVSRSRQECPKSVVINHSWYSLPFLYLLAF